MDMEKRLEQIFASYQNRIALLFDEMKAEILSLTGLEGVYKEEITLGEARKIAILTECMEAEEQNRKITRRELSNISKKYMRNPATCGVFFRPDVNLMETRGNEKERFVTEKARRVIKEYKQKFGEVWINENIKYLIDPNLADDYKLTFLIKIKGEK